MIALCVAAVVISSLAGCGGNGDNATIEQPQVDPRFATAEALLEHFNQLSTSGPTVDVHEIMSLFYGETQWQKLIMRIRSITLPLLQLDQACWDTFGQGLYPYASEPPLTPNRERATMTQVTGERAMATQQENDGKQSDLYLVRYDNRWWVSGYTFEYEPDVYAATRDLDLPDVNLDNVERMFGDLAAVAREIGARLRAGDFASAEEVQAAYTKAMFEDAMNNPQRFLGDPP